MRNLGFVAWRFPRAKKSSFQRLSFYEIYIRKNQTFRTKQIFVVTLSGRASPKISMYLNDFFQYKFLKIEILISVDTLDVVRYVILRSGPVFADESCSNRQK